MNNRQSLQKSSLVNPSLNHYIDILSLSIVVAMAPLSTSASSAASSAPTTTWSSPSSATSSGRPARTPPPCDWYPSPHPDDGRPRPLRPLRLHLHLHPTTTLDADHPNQSHLATNQTHARIWNNMFLCDKHPQNISDVEYRQEH